MHMIHVLYLYRWFKNYHYVMLKRRKRVQVESDKVPMLHQLKAHFANRLTKFEKNKTLPFSSFTLRLKKNVSDLKIYEAIA